MKPKYMLVADDLNIVGHYLSQNQLIKKKEICFMKTSDFELNGYDGDLNLIIIDDRNKGSGGA